MTEKEKMLSGEFYNSRDPELISIYFRARQLTKEYNNLNASEISKRDQILTELLGHKGEKIWIEAPFYCDFGQYIFIGENTFININCTFLDGNKITIGKNGLIGPNVQIYTATHPVNASDRIISSNKKVDKSTYRSYTKPVEIGDNTWIGGNVVIMPGVKIGADTTIGAGSVVTKNIPDNVLAFGNPCKVIKELS